MSGEKIEKVSQGWNSAKTVKVQRTCDTCETALSAQVSSFMSISHYPVML